MCTFRSVKIIHDIIHRADYIFLSEFLRFIGVLVYEDVLFEREIDKTDVEKNTQYSACVYIGEKHLGKENRQILEPIVGEEEYADLVGRLPEETIFFYGENAALVSPAFSQENDDKQIECLKDVMDRILYQISQKVERDQYCFEELIRIYVQNRLVIHSINIQYYSKKPFPFIKEAKGSFIKAYAQLETLDGAGKYTKDMQSHYLYARIWTKVKGNIVCDYMNDILYFSEEQMFDECRHLIDEYPSFSNAKVLLGLCYEPLKKKTRDTIAVFSEALDDIGKESFAASVYYWMGKRYETDGRYPEQMKECYLQSNARSIKFRSLFKLGVIARTEKNYLESIKYFDTILAKLRSKDAIGYTDPLELEYMQKTYLQKCITYYHAQQYDKVRENMELAQNAKNKIDSNELYAILYSEKAEDYRKESKKRIDMQQFKELLKGAF